MPLILSGNVASATADVGYSVANSCRFDGSSSYMTLTPGSAGSQKKVTFSTWFKRGKIAGGGGGEEFIMYASPASNTDTRLYFTGDGDANDDRLYFQSTTDNTTHTALSTNRKFRDPSAWYHVVISVDTTVSSPGSSNIRMFINGVQETSFATATYGAQNKLFYWTDDALHTIGRRSDGTSNYYSGNLAETVLIDGTAYAASDFGEFDEDSPTIWKPKDVSGLTFGTNGFYLDYEASDNLGNDANGGTDFSEAGLAATDQGTDSPTNNFATWNPLAYSGKTAMIEGNLQGYGDNDSSRNEGGIATIGVSTGKWYWENKISAVGGAASVGIYPDTNYNTISNATTELHQGNPSIFYRNDGTKQVDDSNSSYGDSFTTNDIISVALNLDDNEIKFYKNGTVQNSGTAVAVTSISPDFYFPVQAGVSNSSVTGNFGNPTYANSSDAADENGYGAFEYAPPSGFLALCTKNLGSDGG